MKKLIIILLLSAQMCYGQEGRETTAKDLLKTMPQEVLPLLTHNNVLDMLDFLNASYKAEVTNRLNVKSEMTQLTSKSARIALSNSNTVAIHVLPFHGSDVLIYVISTCIADSLRDSEVRVYDSRWMPAPSAQQFQLPHPESYNHVEIDDEKMQLTIVEARHQLWFEGEDSTEKPDEIVERRYVWNSDKGIFDLVESR